VRERERSVCELYCKIQIQTAALQQQLQRKTLFANPQAHSLIIFHRRVHFDKCFSISRASNACKVCISHRAGMKILVSADGIHLKCLFFGMLGMFVIATKKLPQNFH
jgi:hypothetical protein